MVEELTVAKLDTLQAIELAEGVEIRLRTAGPLVRGTALVLDVVFQYVLLITLVMLSQWLLMPVFGNSFLSGLWLLLMFVLAWWYPALFEASRWGATPGKMLMGLRVVQTSGSPISFGQSILRNLLRYADGMPFMFGMGVVGIVPTFGIGLAVMVSTRRFQRLGDLAAGTLVVYSKLEREKKKRRKRKKVTNLVAVEPRAAGVALSAEEVLAIRAFRDRAPNWTLERQVEIGDRARVLTEASGKEGVRRLLQIAAWFQQEK